MCVSCEALTLQAASPYSYGYDSVRRDGRHILYSEMCLGSDQTQHMFIYPAFTRLYPVCHFAWQSLQAIHHGIRSHDLWQRLFLIHKSQKDQFKIHEQSVLQQPVISVTVGQWRHGATEKRVLPPLILGDTQTQAYTHACTHTHKHTHTYTEKVLVVIFYVVVNVYLTQDSAKTWKKLYFPLTKLTICWYSWYLDTDCSLSYTPIRYSMKDFTLIVS